MKSISMKNQMRKYEDMLEKVGFDDLIVVRNSDDENCSYHRKTSNIFMGKCFAERSKRIMHYSTEIYDNMHDDVDKMNKNRFDSKFDVCALFHELGHHILETEYKDREKYESNGWHFGFSSSLNYRALPDEKFCDNFAHRVLKLLDDICASSNQIKESVIEIYKDEFSRYEKYVNHLKSKFDTSVGRVVSTWTRLDTTWYSGDWWSPFERIPNYKPFKERDLEVKDSTRSKHISIMFDKMMWWNTTKEALLKYTEDFIGFMNDNLLYINFDKSRHVFKNEDEKYKFEMSKSEIKKRMKNSKSYFEKIELSKQL